MTNCTLACQYADVDTSPSACRGSSARTARRRTTRCSARASPAGPPVSSIASVSRCSGVPVRVPPRLIVHDDSGASCREARRRSRSTTPRTNCKPADVSTSRPCATGQARGSTSGACRPAVATRADMIVMSHRACPRCRTRRLHLPPRRLPTARPSRAVACRVVAAHASGMPRRASRRAATSASRIAKSSLPLVASTAMTSMRRPPT